MNTQLLVLMVEDSESDARLIARELQRAGYDLGYERVETAEAMKTALAKQEWDLVIADYKLLGFSGPAALETLKERSLDIPFIVVSATIGEENAVAMMKSGAHDYIMKNNLARLVPAVERELREAEGRRKRRQAEAELAKSEARFRAIFDQAGVGVAQINTITGGFVAINQRYCDMAGYDRADMLSMNFMDITHPDDLQADLDNMHLLQTGKIRGFSMDKRYVHKDGNIIWVRLTVSPMWDVGAPPDFHIAVVEDITERRWAEARLRESEEKFRLVFEKAPIGIMHYDQTSTITECNAKFAEIIGAPEEKFIGFNMIRQLRDEQMRKAVAASLDGQVGYYEGDYLSVTAAKLTPVRAIYQPIFSPENVISGGITIFEDITARQRAESELRLKERLLDSASDSIFLHDLEGNFLYMNEAAYITRWYEKEELQNLGAWALATPETAVNQDNILRELCANGEMIFESEHRRKDGSVIPVEIFARLLAVEGRELILSVARDITERHKAEETLRQSRETLRVLLDATPAGVLLLDPQYIVLAANRVVAERLGKPVTDLVGTNIFDYMPPELARSRKERLGEIKRSGNPAIFEDSRGGLFFDNYVHPILSPTGGVAGLAVLSVEITDRKRAEETLLLDEARLEALVNLSQMSGASLEALTHFALEEGVRLTKSNIGYLAFMNKDETVLTMYAWSRYAMDQCAISDKPMEYPLATTGQWGEAVRQRRPVIINDFAAPCPDKKGYPPGHVEVLRHMNLPVFDGERIVAVAGVGNKEEPYNASDVRQLTLLMDGMWKLVQRSQAETALKESFIQLHRTLENTAIALATTVEIRDPCTAGHQKRVALLVCAIGQEMGFSADQLEGMRVMGMLHDIGKIAVPADILNRPGKISEMEFNIVKVHSQVGYDITKDIEFPWPVAQGILQHHERMDGSGYPHGLKGDEIILGGKILAVADVVEAMSSHRPYRPTLGIDKALEEITRNKGILYDPEVVDVCVRLFTEKGFQFD